MVNEKKKLQILSLLVYSLGGIFTESLTSHNTIGFNGFILQQNYAEEEYLRLTIDILL
jgi:hypothetical protein